MPDNIKYDIADEVARETVKCLLRELKAALDDTRTLYERVQVYRRWRGSRRLWQTLHSHPDLIKDMKRDTAYIMSLKKNSPFSIVRRDK